MKSDKDDTDVDEELDAASQGELGDADGDLADQEEEIDAIGDAAGLKDDPAKPFTGIDSKDRRDEKRWELDPDSKEPLS